MQGNFIPSLFAAGREMMKTGIRLHWLLMLMAFVGLVGMLIISGLMLFSLSANLDTQKRLAVRERVELGVSLLAHYQRLADEKKMSDDEARRQALQALQALRTSGNDYFWINDIQARMVGHPYLPDLVGKDISYLRDDQGKPIIQLFVDVALRQGEGFVSYRWPKPNEEEASPKLSYVKYFPHWQWVVGSGEYVDDLHDIFWREVRFVILPLVGVCLFFIVLLIWLRRQVLVHVGSEMNDVARIAGHLSAGHALASVQLETREQSGLLFHLFHAWQTGVAWIKQRGLLVGWLLRRQTARNEINRLAEALKQSSEAIVLAEGNLQFAYVNPAFTRLFGYGNEELQGQSIRLLEVVEQPSVSPEQTAQLARSAGVYRGEVLRRAKDGREIPVLIKVAPVFDEYRLVTGYVASMTDLTEVRAAEQALRASEAKFRAIFDQTFQFIGILDPAGNLLDANRTAQDFYGVDLTSEIGKPFWNLPFFQQSADLPERLRDAVARATRGEVVRFEMQQSGADGSVHYIDFSIKPARDGSGNIVMLIPEGHDVTERKLTEDEAHRRLDEITRINGELNELNRRLSESQNQLLQSEKMASIGVLAAGVAHEINNPVGFIQSNLGTLRQYVADFLQLLDAYAEAEARQALLPEALAELHALRQRMDFDFEREDVAVLLRETQQGLTRVTKIVHDLKDFSRVDSDEQWHEQDLHQGLESTLNIVWNELKYKCEVRKQYGDLPLVECLLSQLNQVFMNLLVNAAQAIDEHGVITISSGVEAGGAQVWIEIADTGKGIPPENLKRIFDPFFTTKPVGKGTGLGLSVSYSIIEKHHGRIQVHSTPGQGTCFRICLPIRQPAAGEKPA